MVQAVAGFGPSEDARFRILVEHGRDVVALHAVDGRYLYVSPSAQRVLGYVPAELIGTLPDDYLHPEDLTRLQPEVRVRLIAGEVQDSIRYRFRCRDGRWIWLESLAVPLYEDADDPARVSALLSSSRDVTAATEAAQQLSTSEERLRLALGTARLGLYDIALPSRAGHYSDEYLRIFGYGPQDRARFESGWEPLVHPDDAKTLTELRRSVWSGECEYMDAQARRMHRDGRWIWVRALGRALEPDAQGRPARWLSTLQDIDQRQRDEATLLESGLRLRQAQTIARLGDWHVEPSTMQHRWSDEAFRLLGLEPGSCEPTLQVFLARVHPDDVERMTQVARELQHTLCDADEETRIVRPDGELRHIHLHIRAVAGTAHRPACLTGTVQDVTERKLAETALRTTAHELALAQRIARVGSWRWTVQDNGLVWSPGMYQILGRDPALPPMPYGEQHRLFTPESWARLLLARKAALADGTPYEVELEAPRGNGGPRWFMARGEASRDAAGRITGIFGTLQDISAYKRAELDLLQARDQLRELSSHHEDVLNQERKRIALDVHDELGQMLTAMNLQLDLLQAQVGNQPGARASTEKLRGLIEDTIEVTRNVALNLRPSALDLGLLPALEWLAEDFTLRSDVPCAVEAATGEVALGEKASTELFRIVQESLTNVARHARARRVHITLKRSDTALHLGVHDDGCGFEPVAARAIGHFGLLGMHERALRLGAQLTIDSKPGHGTHVSVQLPAARPAHTGGQP